MNERIKIYYCVLCIIKPRPHGLTRLQAQSTSYTDRRIRRAIIINKCTNTYKPISTGTHTPI